MKNSVSDKQIESFTRTKIKSLLLQSKENTKTLAELRRGIGKTPGELPQLWGYFLDKMPEEFYGENEPSRAEWSVYTAITLFSLHQQGKDPVNNSMHKDGISLGEALASLVDSEDAKKRIERRFRIIATSNSMEELSHHMRAAIQMLRGANIELDYSKLAVDFYRFQIPELASGVRLKWGQDFYGKQGRKEIDNNDRRIE